MVIRSLLLHFLLHLEVFLPILIVKDKPPFEVVFIEAPDEFLDFASKPFIFFRFTQPALNFLR